MKVLVNNYYGFKLDKLNELFSEGRFIGTTCVQKEYYPVAVFYATNPDRSKGHKDFVLIQPNDDFKVLIRSMDLEEFKDWSTVSAVHCVKCDCVVYSAMRHHMNSCECGAVCIDGGRDYIKTSFKNPKDFESGLLNLITGEFNADLLKTQE